jgi:hypothetical protein
MGKKTETTEQDMKERTMSKVMTKGCTCDQLDDDVKDEGWTCYACYEGDNE